MRLSASENFVHYIFDLSRVFLRKMSLNGICLENAEYLCVSGELCNKSKDEIA